MQEAMKKLLAEMGEDPAREGLAKTPERVAESLKQLTGGYAQKLEDVINGAVFTEKNRGMVVVRDIEFYSLCEHHLLPFFGKVHVGYIPNGKILGLSKIPRVVDMFARRLQVQERMTREIAEAIQKAVQPLGVGVVIEAHHFCMMMRGVEKQSSATVTSSMLGAFREKPATRAEFLSLARQRGVEEHE